MKVLSWVRARPKTLASTAVVTAVAVAITTLALTYDGNPTTEVDLNDGGVWVTKSSNLLVGHFNNESTLLDGGLRTTGENFDIVQDEANVIVVNREESTVAAVDPARVTLGDATSIPGDGKVDLGAKTVAILDRESGDLWVEPVTGLSGFEFVSAKPVLELGRNADVVVGDDGTVYGVSPSKSAVFTLPVDAQGDPLEPTQTAVEGLKKDSKPSITAVGDVPVVLDRQAGVVSSPGGFSTEIAGAGSAVLQQASAGADVVTVATSTDLVRVPLDGSEVQVVPAGAEGEPSAPVSLLGCSYGAWSGSGRFVRECPG
ncbi:hypothetical protein M2317_003061, partial [Microbacterium sp. ZKA21]